MRRRSDRRPARGTGLLLTALIVAGCGSAPPRLGTQGVDGLTIPTPSADPADFREGVDNPWLPLSLGSTWTYSLSGGGRRHTVLVTVQDRSPVISGIDTTQVRRTELDTRGTVVSRSLEWYAQDRAGNVWLLGSEAVTSTGAALLRPDPSWRAGVGGAEAGIAMLASPRVGDGYVRAADPGAVEDLARVVALGVELGTEVGDLSGVVLTEDTSVFDPGRRIRRWYAPDIGLVRQSAMDGAADLELLSFDPG